MFKDVKIMFRNPISIFLVLLLPLIFIGVIGYSFYSFTYVDVNLGIMNNMTKGSDFEKFIYSDFDKGITTIEYNESEKCKKDIIEKDIDMCLLFKDREIPNTNFYTYEIEFIEDHSKGYINNLLKDYIRRKINSIVVKKTREHLDDLHGKLENFSQKINSYKDDFQKIKKEISSLRESVSLLETELTSNIDYFKDKKETFDNKLELVENQIENISKMKTNITGHEIEIDDIVSRKYFTQITNEISSLKNYLNVIEKNLEKNVKDSKSSLKNYDTKFETIIEEIEKISKRIEEFEETLDNKKNLDYLQEPLKIRTSILVEKYSLIKDLIPTLIGFLTLFLGVLFSNSICSIDKDVNIEFRNFFSKTNSFTFFLSKLILSLVLILFQFSLLFLLLRFILKITLPTNIFLFFLSMGIFILIFSLWGMFFSYLFKNEQTSMLTSIFFILTLLFLSDIILPVKLMTYPMYLLSKINPVYLSITIFKKFVLYDYFSIKHFVISLIVLVVLFVLVFLFRRYKIKKWILE